VRRIDDGKLLEINNIDKSLHSKEDLEQVLIALPFIAIKLTNDYKVNKWNASAESHFGISASDVLDTPFSECDIQWNRKEIVEKVSLCSETKSTVKIEGFKYKQKSGNEGFLGITIVPVNNDKNEQVGILLMMRDITGSKDLEQIISTSKLEAIGSLAAGIAHEINTPIQFISNNTVFFQDAFDKIATILNKYLHLLDMNKAGSVTPELLNELEVMANDIQLEYLVEEIPVAIEETQNGLKHVTEIVQSMKTFSHPDNEKKVPVDINKMIKSTITVASNEWKRVAEMVTNFDSELPPVQCFPGDFNQVVLNLIVNAAHAIDEVSGNRGTGNGIISVSTHYDENWVEIRIGDTGAGIPENVRPRIFEQFFTTKEVGKGTGQGLAIAHSVVVNKHKGEIAFDTEVGKGTTFIIRLPILK
jgi:PAS domain S-box-containing protein